MKVVKRHEIAKIIAALDYEITSVISHAHTELSNLFDSNEESNEATVTSYERHNGMAWYKIVTGIATKYKGYVDSAKKQLDNSALNPDGISGEEVTMYSSNVFTYKKKQNVDTTTVAAKDLVTELSRLGVEKSLLDSALVSAEKIRKGNTYYKVEAKYDDDACSD
mgnify:FL=1